MHWWEAEICLSTKKNHVFLWIQARTGRYRSHVFAGSSMMSVRWKLQQKLYLIWNLFVALAYKILAISDADTWRKRNRWIKKAEKFSTRMWPSCPPSCSTWSQTPPRQRPLPALWSGDVHVYTLLYEEAHLFSYVQHFEMLWLRYALFPPLLN